METIQANTKTDIYKLSVLRITALWAFSESTLGGILHAFKIPFTGFFIGGAAVLFITLIAKYSDRHSAILRSTVIVIIIKALVSPHTPLTAYFAVFVQGLLGHLLFYRKNFFSLSALLLGILALLLSALQKVVILTLLFGNNLWESLDLFADQVTKQLGYNGTSIKLSWIMAGGYILLHLIGGIIFGITAGRLPRWIESRMNQDYEVDPILLSNFTFERNAKKSFWKKPGILIFIFFLFVMLLFSFTDNSLGDTQLSKIIIMLIRSAAVMSIWFFFISPYLMRLFHKILKRRMTKYSDEINDIINIFPFFRHILGLSWKRSSEYHGLNKLEHFLSSSFILLLLSGIDPE